MKKEKTKINKDILMGKLVADYPEIGRVLVEEYGLHCVGCMTAGMETLEQGAKVHGMSDKEIDRMVADLRQLAEADQK